MIKAPAPYHLPADGPDQYWNFVLPLKVPNPRWVKAIEVGQAISRPCIMQTCTWIGISIVAVDLAGK